MKKKNVLVNIIAILFVAIISIFIGAKIGENRIEKNAFRKIQFEPLDTVSNEADLNLALGKTYFSTAKILAENELIFKKSEEKNLQALSSYLKKAKKKTQNSILLELEISEHQKNLENTQSDIEKLNAFLEFLSNNDVDKILKYLQNNAVTF